MLINHRPMPVARFAATQFSGGFGGSSSRDPLDDGFEQVSFDSSRGTERTVRVNKRSSIVALGVILGVFGLGAYVGCHSASDDQSPPAASSTQTQAPPPIQTEPPAPPTGKDKDKDISSQDESRETDGPENAESRDDDEARSSDDRDEDVSRSENSSSESGETDESGDKDDKSDSASESSDGAGEKGPGSCAGDAEDIIPIPGSDDCIKKDGSNGSKDGITFQENGYVQSKVGPDTKTNGKKRNGFRAEYSQKTQENLSTDSPTVVRAKLRVPNATKIDPKLKVGIFQLKNGKGIGAAGEGTGLMLAIEGGQFVIDNNLKNRNEPKKPIGPVDDQEHEFVFSIGNGSVTVTMVDKPPVGGKPGSFYEGEADSGIPYYIKTGVYLTTGKNAAAPTADSLLKGAPPIELYSKVEIEKSGGESSGRSGESGRSENSDERSQSNDKDKSEEKEN